MRHSLEQHNVARLRAFLNKSEKIDQQEFAGKIGCSVHTLQSIESGRLKLSEKLAHSISRETDVDVAWLLKNNRKAPIVRFFDTPYTFEDYERAQASKAPEFMEMLSADYAVAFYAQLRAILSSAAKRGRADIALYRVAKVLENCRRDFGHDKELLPPRTRQFSKRPDNLPSLKHWQVESGIRLFSEWIRDRERSAAHDLPLLKKLRVKRQRSGNRLSVT
jgi:transcriptional regulator with XRE-family HTH domain